MSRFPRVSLAHLPTPAISEAVILLLRLEGLLVDPVYSGKALAGLIHRVNTGCFHRSESIVSLHTGGSAALFAYAGQLQVE